MFKSNKELLQGKSDKVLSDELTQLLKYVSLNNQAVDLLSVIAHRLQYAARPQLVPATDLMGVKTVEITHFDENNPKHVIECISDYLGKQMFYYRAPRQLQDFGNGILARIQDVCNFDNRKLSKVILQYKEDMSDYRVIFIGMIKDGPSDAFMVTPSDAYSFMIRTNFKQEIPTAETFIFWGYDWSYRCVGIDEDGKIGYDMWAYSLGKSVKYTKTNSVVKLSLIK